MRRVKIHDRLLPPDPDPGDSETVPGAGMALRISVLQEEVRMAMLVIAYLVDQRGGLAEIPRAALEGDSSRRVAVMRNNAGDGILVRTDGFGPDASRWSPDGG